jgi:lipopolysaccharide transport system ATP-binding protein
VTKTTAVRLSGVSKKFCRSLKRSMLYGFADVVRGTLALPSRADVLRRDEFFALRDVSLEVEPGEAFAVIGPNGAGKSTLLKVLAGILPPDSGRAEVRGRTGALIELGAGFHPLLSGRENISVNAAILGMSRAELHRAFDSIVAFADIGDFLDTPVKQYSSGMLVRLGFAVAVHCRPDVLLVDEVLAVGDEGFQVKCMNKLGELRSAGTAIILVSHNMHAVSGFARRALLLVQGQARCLDDVAQTVRQYKDLFRTANESEIERHCSGTDAIRFTEVSLPTKDITPGTPLEVVLSYQATEAYHDVEVALALLVDQHMGLYFEVTSRASGLRVDLPTGEHRLRVALGDLHLHHTSARLSITIWRRGREGLLLWWRIPVRFGTLPGFNGTHVLQTEIEVF